MQMWRKELGGGNYCDDGCGRRRKDVCMRESTNRTKRDAKGFICDSMVETDDLRPAQGQTS